MWSFVPTSNQVQLDIDITNLMYCEVYCKSLTLYCIHSNLVQINNNNNQEQKKISSFSV